MNDKVLDPNLFTSFDFPEDFELVVGEKFERKFYFIYNGNDNQYGARLYGNPKTTGIETTGLVHEADGRFSIHIFGRPKLINKNTMRLRLFNQTEYIEYEIVFHVKGLKFLDTNLPNAHGVREEYSTRIHFYNPSTLKPKFMYNFPIEFGRVQTEVEDGIDYTTIKLSPSASGKFKFHVTALSEDNIEMGTKTVNLEVIDPDRKDPEPVFVKAVDYKDWK